MTRTWVHGLGALIAAAAISVSAASCDPPTAQSGAPVFFGDAQAYPEGCAALRLVGEVCDAVVEDARSKLGVDHSAIEAIDILTEDRCGEARELLCTRATAFIAGVRFTLKGGSTLWATVVCVPGMKAIYCI